MNQVDISKEIMTTLHTIFSMINVQIKEAEMPQQYEGNIVQLRVPGCSSKELIMRRLMNRMHSLQPWQQIQMHASLRAISNTIYDTADECVEMAEITNAISNYK